ncbi:MAG: hypothetical protein UT05_C0014G0001 [Parcubacteria group bacterium GW2011_GWF2_38_76]|nr:MAG: hypothetical protein UT05_C0014G0001 [Parcubacteria group bacterium GW2011_GWF2_38_76]HBM46023.1 hypothetical protein [Patescibacteria group bacterium]
MLEIFSFFLWIGASLLFFVVMALLILKMAENDICFTKNVSGRVKAIVAGEQVVKWLGWTPGYHIFSETGEVVNLEKVNDEIKKKATEDISLIDKILHPLGLTFIGIWPLHNIYKYKFKWTEWVKKDGSMENVAVSREGTTDHMRIRFPYLIKVSGLEGEKGLPADYSTLITVEIKNASRALFNSGGEWMTNLSASVNSKMRDWVGSHTFEELTEMQSESSASGFLEHMLKLNHSSDGNIGLIESIGVEIVSANYFSPEISGDNKEELIKATTVEYIAEKKAAATKKEAEGKAASIVINAKAEAEATTLNGHANAEAMKKMLDAVHSHPEGVQIQIAKELANGLKNSKLTTLVTGGGATPLLNIIGGGTTQNNGEPKQETKQDGKKKKKGEKETEQKDKENTEVNNDENS